MWLLKRLLSGPNRESLIGDLVERHGHGQSGAWFWRQVVGAIVSAMVAEIRAHYVAISLVAFFVGFGAAAILGTIKLVPELGLLDELVVGLGAGWVVCRIGGPATVFVFALLVLSMDVTAIYSPVMSALDHFRGLWVIAHYGVAALPSSIILAEISLLGGALFAARPLPREQSGPSASA
jgi:hypothetical protein